MKTIKTFKTIKYLLLGFCMLSLGCYDDDTLSSKPGEPIAGVSNLTHNVNGNELTLSWDLPSSYPEGIITPVGVQIVVSVDGQREGGAILLQNDPLNFIYTNYDPGREYRFTLKVVAMMEIKESEPYVSPVWFSEGTTLSL